MPISRNKELNFRQSHAFVIGINQYPGIDSPLKTPIRDSIEIAKRLKVLQGFDNVMLLNNVTLAELQELLEWLKKPQRKQKLSIESGTHTYRQLALPANPEEEGFDEVEAIILPKISFLKLEKELTDEERKIQSNLPQIELEYQLGKTKGLQETLYLTPASAIDIHPQPEHANSEHQGDSILFYFAGHGFPGKEDEGPSGFLAPSDTQNKRVDNESLLPMNEVYQALSAANCKHTMLILDCCFSGSFRFSTLTRKGSMPMVVPVHERRFKRYKDRNAWQVLASSGPDQEANDSSGMKAVRDHSPFAITLIKALEGRADVPLGNRGKFQGDGIITATELYLYVWEKVEEMTHTKKPQHPGLFPMAQHRDGEFVFVNPLIDSDRFLFAEDPDKNPYKGLKPYEKEDLALFFGRDRAINEVLAQLNEVKVLFVTGGSGTGKSSLIRAGVVPKLERRKKNPIAETVFIRPAELVNPQRQGWEWELGGQEPNPMDDKLDDKLDELKAKLEKGQEENRRLLLVIDQYEEMFMHAEKEQIQHSVVYLFDKILISQFHQLIFTLRSDFEWQMKRSSLEKYWDKSRIYRIPPMEPGELREALTGPAFWAMYDFKDHAEARDNDTGEQLINKILDEITNAPGALPLLSFTMQSFYEESKNLHRKQKLIKADYEDVVKGVEGALASRASKLFASLSEGEKKLMEKLMIRMVNIYDGSFTRRRVFYRHDLAVERDTKLALIEQKKKQQDEIKAKHNEVEKNEDFIDEQPIESPELSHHDSTFFRELDFPGDDTELTALIVKLEFNHLVIKGVDKDGNTFVEPAHDALITHWDHCRDLIDQFGKESLNLQRQIWNAVLEFEKQKEASEETSKDYLWDSNPRLQQVFDSVIDPQGELSKPEHTHLKEALHLLFQDNREDEDFKENIEKLIHWWNRDESIVIPETLDLKEGGIKLITFMVNSGLSWLNEPEVDFVLASWEKQVAWTKQLKKERDEAKRQAFESKVTTLAAKAYNKRLTDPTIAYNMAYESYQLFQSKETASAFYNMGSGEEALYNEIFKGHTHYVLAVCFSPNGKSVLTGSYDKTARLWDLEGNVLETFQGHTHPVLAVCFSPDGKSILTGSYDKTARLWELAGNVLQTFEGHTEGVTAACFSSDGKSVLTGSDDKTARLWDLAGNALQTFEGHTKGVTAACFSPDGQSVLTGSSDKTARLWNLAGNTLQTFEVHNSEGHSSGVHVACFSPDGKSILTNFGDKTARLWDLKGKQLQIFKGHTSFVYAVAFSPDGKSILTGGDKTAILWDVEGNPLHTFQVHTDYVLAVCFSPDGKSALTGSYDETACLWGLTGNALQTFEGHTDEIHTACFSPDGQSVLTGSGDKTARLWDLSGNTLQTFKGHGQYVNTTCFSPDGQSVLTGSGDKTARLWDLSGNVLQSLEGHTGQVSAACFSPDGQSVLTGSGDETARLWDLSGNVLQTFEEHSQYVSAVCFSPDGQSVLTGSFDNTACLWDLSGNVLQTFEGFDGDATSKVLAACFSPDGQSVLIGFNDNTARLWDLAGNVLQTFEGYTSYVTAVGFSPDGQFVLTGSFDSTACLWDLSGNALRIFEGHTDKVNAACFSPDGKTGRMTILTGSTDKTAKLWHSPLHSFPPHIYQLNKEERKEYGLDIEY